MQLFVDKEKKIEIKIYLAQNSKGELIASDSLDNLLKNEYIVTPKEEIEEHSFYFRNPSYKDNVDVLSKTLKHQFQIGEENIETNTLSADPALIQYVRFQSLLIDWTLKDNEEKKIPVTKDRIDKLNPVIANVVVSSLDNLLS